jgi:hypothetical protein
MKSLWSIFGYELVEIICDLEFKILEIFSTTSKVQKGFVKL